MEKLSTILFIEVEQSMSEQWWELQHQENLEIQTSQQKQGSPPQWVKQDEENQRPTT